MTPLTDFLHNIVLNNIIHAVLPFILQFPVMQQDQSDKQQVASLVGS
jgi:hypothetical protein